MTRWECWCRVRRGGTDEEAGIDAQRLAGRRIAALMDDGGKPGVVTLHAQQVGEPVGVRLACQFGGRGNRVDRADAERIHGGKRLVDPVRTHVDLGIDDW